MSRYDGFRCALLILRKLPTRRSSASSPALSIHQRRLLRAQFLRSLFCLTLQPRLARFIALFGACRLVTLLIVLNEPFFALDKSVHQWNVAGADQVAAAALNAVEQMERSGLLQRVTAALIIQSLRR